MIRTETDAGLWKITLDRPDKANALTREMLTGLRGVLQSAQGQARCLVVTATGSVFSAGADLDEARAGLATDPVWEEVSGAMAAFDGLSICALNGALAGGAFGMALAADLRIAVPSAKFFYPVASLGFLPQPSDPVRLAALVGPARAKLIMLAGAKLTAQEALTCGLIDRIAEPESLLECARSLAAPALEGKPGHVSAIKAMIPH